MAETAFPIMDTPPAKSARVRFALVIEVGDEKDFRNHSKDAHERCAYLKEKLGGFVVDVYLGNLKAGDMALVVYDPDVPPEKRKLVIVFERKSMSDFLSSIRGIEKRYKSQAQRMVRTGAYRCMWMIVGDDPPLASDVEIVDSAVMHLNLSYRNTRAERIADHRDSTVEWLKKVIHYVEDDMNGGFNGENIVLPSFKVGMHNGRLPRLESQDECWIEQLTVPRGIGPGTARQIAARYPSATHLLLAYGAVVAKHPADLKLLLASPPRQICVDDDDEPISRTIAPASSSSSSSSASAAAAAPVSKKRMAKRDDPRTPLEHALDDMISENVTDASGKRLVGPANSRRIRETFIRPEDMKLLAKYNKPKKTVQTLLRPVSAAQLLPKHDKPNLSLPPARKRAAILCDDLTE